MSRDISEGMRAHAMKIMEALSGVDEELLERCDDAAAEKGKEKRRAARSHRRPVWQTAGAWAAVLCLALAGAASWRGYRLLDEGGDGSAGGGPRSGEVYGENQMCATGAGEAQGASHTSGAAPEGAEEVDAENRQTAAAQTDMNQGKEEYVALENGAEKENRKNSAGKGNGGDNGGTEEHGSEEDSADAPGEEDTIMEGCSRLNAIEYTEQEARSLEGLGEYVPETLPEGYVFERAYSNSDLGRENLTVSWIRGMDLILLQLERTQGTVDVADVNRPETYDQRLYKVPYGETVPEEYRQVFQNPVFSLEDLSREIIESRMTVYEDAGDTDTPRGNFRVLYPDGVLASFNGRGTAQEIWDMFSSVER